MIKFFVVMIISMMLLCPYFIFIDTSLSNHLDMLFNIGFSLEDKWSLSLGELIRPFASWFLTVIYYVLLNNNALGSDSNAFSLIICKVYTKRENTGSWNYGPEKAHQRYLFCTSPKKLKFYGEYFWNIWKILEQITTGGGHPGGHKTPGRARPPWRALVGCALLGPHPVPIFW